MVISPKKSNLPPLALMLGVEVSWLVLLVVHPDDDSEEYGNHGHGLSIASATVPVGPTSAMSRGAQEPMRRRLHRMLGRLFYPAFRARFFDVPFALKSTTRRPSAPSLRRRARASALRSFPCSFAIAARIARTSSTIGSRHMNLRLHQFFRCTDDGCLQASRSTCAFDLATNCCICDVSTIPRHEVRDVIYGGHGNMDGIGMHFGRHRLLLEGAVPRIQ